MGTISLYESRSLTAAVNQIKPVNTELIKLLGFKNENHSSDIIDWEVISDDKRIAQFVSREATEAKPVKKTARSAKTARIPRTWEEKVFTAQEMKDFSVLGNIYAASAKERDDAINSRIFEELDVLQARAIRRRVQMITSILSTGKVIIDQEDYQAEIDSGMITGTLANGGHLVDVSGSLDWSSSTASIDTFIHQVRQTMSKRGKTSRVCILGSEASVSFMANEKVKKVLDNNNVQAGRLSMNSPQDSSLIPVGSFYGVQFYEHSEEYKNDAGSIVPMIDPKKAIFVDPNSNNKMHLAPIHRFEGEKHVSHQAEFFISSRVEKNQTLAWDIEQKALPQIKDIDSVLSVKVIPG
jgi:hypothetical protein